MSDTAKVAVIPTCDVCKTFPAVYDGKTVHGPWAYMCQACWDEIGIGRLGTGFGQRLVVREGAGQ